jgi:hypothetical protein
VSSASRSARSRNLDRYDQFLLAAKNSGKKVSFDLAYPISFTDDEGVVVGLVCQVDKYSIEIQIVSSGRRVWIAKPMIVGTEVL